MSVASVDIDKSIQRKRLVYKITSETFFNYLFTYAIGLLLLFGSIAPNFNTHINHPLVITATFSMVAIWMASNLLLLNTMVKFEGSDIKSNLKDLGIILNGLYGEISLNNSDGRLIRNVKLTRGFRWGRIITVILDGENVYLNITTLGRGNSPSPFHGLYNYFICKRIAGGVKTRQI